MTEKRPAHTAGRLEFETPRPGRRERPDAEPSCYFVYGESDGLVANVYNDRGDGEANAARLVACWNALDGVADPEEAVRLVRGVLRFAAEEPCWGCGADTDNGHDYGCKIARALAALDGMEVRDAE